MATYKAVKGFTIQSLGSDPSPLLEGQVWYNTSSNTLKGSPNFTATGSWASGGTLNTVRPSNFGGATGPQTAALAFGGYTVPAAVTDKTESYNGTSWTETGHTLNAARYGTGSTGTQTAALCMAGNQVSPDHGALVEEYNGSSWVAKNAMPSGHAEGSGAGTTEAAKFYSGRPVVTAVYDFDGTNWTTGTAMTTARDQAGGGGTNTDAVCVAGGPPVITNFEKWNGSSWSEAPDINNARRAASASVTDGDNVMLAGGEGGAPNYLQTELYNGTAWSVQAVQATPHYKNAGSGTASAGLAVGTSASPYALTEEWTIPTAVTAKTFSNS